jgi:rhodanese-related sulfurtransferase
MTMGPLVPEIIGNDLNFIVALIIGIAFGAILEQAGFSTSRKLVGLFYGYDFTVLRVFFTAGVVAMIGVMGLEHFGLLDINLVYVNPTFLWSAIIGGLIMGLGFVIGGFCPGTSVCAAAIGKIDAMIFIGGAVLGVFVFAEGYPVFEGLYKAANWGNPRMFETLGLPQHVFAFLLTVVALGAFVLVSVVENRVNGIDKQPVRMTRYYIGLASVGLIIAFSAFLFPERKAALETMVGDAALVESYPLDTMAVDELAYRLINEDQSLQLIDFRSAAEASMFSLPGATTFTIDNLFEKEPNQVLTTRGKTKVFIAEDEARERKIAIMASELGYRDICVLRGGLTGFRARFLPPVPSSPRMGGREEMHTERFLAHARTILPAMIQKSSTAHPVKKTQKRVLGGC